MKQVFDWLMDVSNVDEPRTAIPWAIAWLMTGCMVLALLCLDLEVAFHVGRDYGSTAGFLTFFLLMGINVVTLFLLSKGKAQ